jgi:hypothetical protein
MSYMGVGRAYEWYRVSVTKNCLYGRSIVAQSTDCLNCMTQGNKT